MKLLVAPQSGSYQGLTASRNRFGQYIRTRAIPVQPRTTFQVNVRAALAANSAAWRGLTDAQRAGWDSLALNISRTDSLGQVYQMTGQQCYVSVNNNQVFAGNAVLAAAPAIVTPPTLLTATVTLTAAAFSIAYTTTPLAAGQRLFSFVSPMKSAGVAFCGDYRLVAVSAAAAASPANLFAAYQTRFGTPVVGTRIFMKFQIYSGGFMGQSFDVAQVVA